MLGDLLRSGLPELLFVDEMLGWKDGFMVIPDVCEMLGFVSPDVCEIGFVAPDVWGMIGFVEPNVWEMLGFVELDVCEILCFVEPDVCDMLGFFADTFVHWSTALLCPVIPVGGETVGFGSVTDLDIEDCWTDGFVEKLSHDLLVVRLLTLFEFLATGSDVVDSWLAWAETPRIHALNFC